MLWHYVKARDYKKVKFLKCDADATLIGQDGITPVHLVLVQGDIIDEIIAKMLLASRPTSSISEILQASLRFDELPLYRI
ncbi:hypothetical protein N7451_009109 [Penicillium sp. IBT 35674x]|nr:hypothetical protein N7451_009109 [Penicillium sp. IBT 35674x]